MFGTAKSRAAQYTDIDTLFPSNTAGAITAAKVREGLKTMVDSAYNSIDDGAPGGGDVDAFAADPSTNLSFSASAWRTDLSLVIGTNVQAWSAALDTFASNGSAYYLSRANHTGTQTMSTISDAGALATLSAVASAQITDGTIVNADINASAAIALSKLATDPLARANHTGTQTMSTISDAGTLATLSAVASAQITDGTIVNADINASAAIAASKLVGTDIATVGTLTAGATGAGFTVALGTSTVTGTLGVTNGGNGLATATLGDLRYGSGTNTLAALAGNTSTTMAVLCQTGNGTVSAAPAWTSTSGTGNIARVTSPVFVTPTLGAATATSLTLTNGGAITDGGTGAITLTAAGSSQNITATPSGTGDVIINSAGTSGQNLLIATSTDSANGRIQLASHTTSAGGVGFGTDLSLYRSSAGVITADSGALLGTGGFRAINSNASGAAAITLVNSGGSGRTFEFGSAGATSGLTVGQTKFYTFDITASQVMSVANAASGWIFYSANTAALAIDSSQRTSINSTSAVSGIRTGIATRDFPSVAADGGTQDLTITVTGAATGNSVSLGLPAAPEAGIVWNAWVSATNTVTIRATNPTTGAIDPASASFRVTVTSF